MPDEQKVLLRENPANELSYSSYAFPEEAGSNFGFCQIYYIDDKGHWGWTRDVEIFYWLYIERYQLMDGVDKAVYDYCKSMSNRRFKLSVKGLAFYIGVGQIRILQALDRLQDLGLLHRVCRRDANGGGHDYIVHAPFKRKKNPRYAAGDRREPQYLKELHEVDLAWMMERINYGHLDDHARRFGERCHIGYTKAGRLDRRDEPVRGIRHACCGPDVTYDLREIRMYFHEGRGPADNNGKIPRRYSKPDRVSDLFFTYIKDALKQMYKSKHRVNRYKGDKADGERRKNWQVFKGHLQLYCKGDKNGDNAIALNNHRWIAALKMGNFYAPNLFEFVEI